MAYVNLGGVDCYLEVTGTGPPVLLLHGGYCSLEVLRPMSSPLTDCLEVHAYERPGHGRTPDTDGPYSYEAWVADAVAYLDGAGIVSAHVVGYSDGAIIGLLLARDHPQRVRSLVAMSANLDPSGFVSEDLYAQAMPTEGSERIDEENARLSPDGPEHIEVVASKLHALWVVEPRIAPASLAAITAPVLVMAAEHDMVTLEHTRMIAAAISGARLTVVPAASHLFVEEQPAWVGALVRDFLAAVDAP